MLIRLVVDLMTAANSEQEPRVRKLSEFALRSPYACPRTARDLSQIKLFIDVAVEKGKDRPSALAKKDTGERFMLCTHSRYKCT